MRLLKDRPIAQGVLGNAIFHTLWQGGSGALSWLAGHSAYVQGLALHWAISLGVAVFLALIIAANFVSLVIHRHRQPPGMLETQEGSQLGIVSLIDHQDVGLHETVFGYVIPANLDVQMLVLSGDGRWYPQGPANVRGSGWSAKCQFGDSGRPGGYYKVVAVCGERLTERNYGHLPDGLAKSDIYSVQRLQVVDG